MGRVWLWLKRIAQKFRRSRSANISLMFGFSLLPLAAAAGIAVDYSRASAIRSKLDNAADIAALASVSKNAAPFVTAPTQTSVRTLFDAVATGLPDVTITAFQVNVVTSVTDMSVTVTYSGAVQTTLAGVIGVRTIAIGGTSTAKIMAPPYVDFYLLLDNSPSMGLGATDTDISHLQSLTPDSCAFACHKHTFDSSGKITGDDLNDYYHIAKNNNVTVRIDVLRTATQQLTQTATNSETVANQFRMGVYTFSDTFQTVTTLSSDMPTVAANASTIDLAYAYYNQRDTQTSYDTALSYINNIMPVPGNGSSSTSPQEFLFMVTDGVGDLPVSGGSGASDPYDTPTSYLPANTQPNLANTLTGNVNSKRLIGTLNLSQCQTIKDRGIKIAVLYTPYLPVTNNGFYNTWVAPISSSIPTNLQSCASPNFYFQITPTQGISAAMQTMFQAAINSVLLTN
jgi:Flp pilus assembly protein TadG